MSRFLGWSSGTATSLRSGFCSRPCPTNSGGSTNPGWRRISGTPRPATTTRPGRPGWCGVPDGSCWSIPVRATRKGPLPLCTPATPFRSRTVRNTCWRTPLTARLNWCAVRTNSTRRVLTRSSRTSPTWSTYPRNRIAQRSGYGSACAFEREYGIPAGECRRQRRTDHQHIAEWEPTSSGFPLTLVPELRLDPAPVLDLDKLDATLREVREFSERLWCPGSVRGPHNRMSTTPSPRTGTAVPTTSLGLRSTRGWRGR